MASCVSTPIHSPISMFQTTSLRHYYEGLLDSHHTQQLRTNTVNVGYFWRGTYVGNKSKVV